MTPSFSARSSGWRVSWIFGCSAAESGLASFRMTVNSAAAAPLVGEVGPGGSGVATGAGTGVERLRITSDARCVWALKVTAASPVAADTGG